jgi:acetyl-CoA C-acetyltransferase
MGSFGEDCAAHYGFSRAAQDAFAIESVQRAQAAASDGAFDWELAPVDVATRAGITRITSDEGPRRIDPARIASLRPAFRADGTITAASASSINDGAAALLLMRASRAAQLGLTPLARVIAHSAHARAPGWFTTAPIGALQRLFERCGWRPGEVDLYEINEAFAVVPMAVMAELGVTRERINVHGGACALGHPIGASGARIVVTLLGAMRRQGARRGVACLCIGGGEATALAIEAL